MTHDIAKIRAKNGTTLLRACNSHAEFADKVGISRTQVSIYLGKNPTAKIGE